MEHWPIVHMDLVCPYHQHPDTDTDQPALAALRESHLQDQADWVEVELGKQVVEAGSAGLQVNQQ